MTEIKKYQLMRYSPGRESWVLWNEMYDSKQDADTRVQELSYIYRNQPELKFKTELVTYNPEKRELTTQLEGLARVDKELKEKITLLKEDPKKEKVKELSAQKKAIKAEQAALQARLKELTSKQEEKEE